MSTLRFQPVRPDDAVTLADWLRIHNLIIPTAVLSMDDMHQRVRRNHLTVAYRGDTAVGCSTVRPPADDTKAATVIARILPEHRRQGHGQQLYENALAEAYDLGADVIQTVVLASNEDGLRFAERRGFVEIDRYVLDGDTIPFIDLQLRPR
ncbi:GNAT family N-acetyltransferase [Fodinicola acaciae]|uniref:GNAT family N-acetyltransferase n=1 Tax=Fodinicola acaciae TaxID=2681555 RepID=UPI001651B21B|nr:GNAT family N-acetyltransferase [Fodinicola acaciae]